MSIIWSTQNSEEKSVKLIVEWKDCWFLIDFLTKARHIQFRYFVSINEHIILLFECFYSHASTQWLFLRLYWELTVVGYVHSIVHTDTQHSKFESVTGHVSVNITLKMLKVWSVIQDNSNNWKRWKRTVMYPILIAVSCPQTGRWTSLVNIVTCFFPVKPVTTLTRQQFAVNSSKKSSLKQPLPCSA